MVRFVGKTSESLQGKIESGEPIKVLGVYPEAGFDFWSHDRSLKIAGKKATMPPTGLLTVLAMLPERFEAIPILDLNTTGLSEERLEDSDLIFTSSMIVHQSSHDKILELAAKMGKSVVAGGPLPTAYPERVNKANHIVAGEAEITLLPFLEDLIQGKAARHYTEGDCISRTKVKLTREGKPLLDGTPIPRWDLVNLKDYFTVGIQYSRGCPNHCEFCDIPGLYGHIPRTKSPEKIVEEIRQVHSRGFDGEIFVVDDNFIGNREEAMKALLKIAKYQKEVGYRSPINTEAGLNLAWPGNKDLRDAMIDAGVDHVFVGIESPDPNVLKKMNKKHNLRMAPLDSVRVLQESGFGVTAGFIVGNDSERKSVFNDMFEFIQKSGIVTPMVGLLGVGKGTPLYDRLEKEGRLKPKETEGTNTHKFRLDYIPQCELDEKEIVEGYKGLLKKLYLDEENYYARCERYHETLGKNHSNAGYGFDFRTLATLGRFLKHLTFGGATKESLKYLASTLVKDPKHFAHAATHVTKHWHFKEVTRAALEAEEYSPHVDSLYEGLCKRAGMLVDKYGHKPMEVFERVSREANRVLKRAEKAYSKLHEDFREKATSRLADLRLRIANKEYLA